MQEDDKDKKESGRWLIRLAASEFLFYACYNWYIHQYAPVEIDGTSLVVWNIVITGAIFLFLSLFDN